MGWSLGRVNREGVARNRNDDLRNVPMRALHLEGYKERDP